MPLAILARSSRAERKDNDDLRYFQKYRLFTVIWLSRQLDG